MLTPFLAGAIVMGSWAVALFFLRFFRQTRDDLFVWFAIAFFLLGGEKLFNLLQPVEEIRPYIYLVRLLAFILIVFGIISKNRQGNGKPRQTHPKQKERESTLGKHERTP